MTTTNDGELLTTKQAAELVGLTPSSVKAAVKSGRLTPAQRRAPSRGGHLFFKADVLRWRRKVEDSAYRSPPPQPPRPGLLSIKEAAAHVGVKTGTLTASVDCGRIGYEWDSSRRWRFVRAEEVEAFYLPPKPGLLSARQATDLTGIPTVTLYQASRRGVLPRVEGRPGSAWFRKEDVLHFAEHMHRKSAADWRRDPDRRPTPLDLDERQTCNVCEAAGLPGVVKTRWVWSAKERLWVQHCAVCKPRKKAKTLKAAHAAAKRVAEYHEQSKAAERVGLQVCYACSAWVSKDVSFNSDRPCPRCGWGARASDRSVCRQWCWLYRASKARSTVEQTAEQREVMRLLEECVDAATDDLDHIIPLKVSNLAIKRDPDWQGGDVAWSQHACWNVRPTTRAENRGKGDRWGPDEFASVMRRRVMFGAPPGWPTRRMLERVGDLPAGNGRGTMDEFCKQTYRVPALELFIAVAVFTDPSPVVPAVGLLPRPADAA